MRRIWAIILAGFVFTNILGFYNIEFKNAGGEITILGGHITTNTTWYLSQSPYYIEGNVTVDENVTLTIEPGVNVRFNIGYGLYVDGILNAVGLQDKMINFTSNVSSPSTGDWDRIQINSTGNINIIYCNISYADYGLYLSNTSNNNITNNDIYKNRDYGIYLNNSFYNRLESNIISYNNFRSIFLNLSSFNDIIDNDIYQTGGKSGITLSSSSNNYIGRNNIYSNGHYGIYFKYSSNNTIIKNNLSSNLDENIYISFSNNNLIMKNDVYNSPIGIDIASSSYNNIINNKVYSNYQIGIFVTTSSYNNITNNNLSNNDLGTWIRTNSNFNRIYHNNFFNNTIQAIDEEANNFWNQSYPSGGNYWSDYNGTDLNSTPNQDVPPPDGIGDTPYVIDANSQDNYPLMYPWGRFIFLNYGWNLISLPVIQSNNSLDSVLASITGSYDAVQWYNASDNSDNWKHNHKLKPNYLNDLDGIDHGIGFWIHITELGGVLFEYQGSQPTQNQTITLHPGWNMVGYPSLTNYNRTKGLNNLTFDTYVDAIQWYDVATKSWHFMDQDDFFVPGRGYWVHSKIEAEWEVPL